MSTNIVEAANKGMIQQVCGLVVLEQVGWLAKFLAGSRGMETGVVAAKENCWSTLSISVVWDKEVLTEGPISFVPACCVQLPCLPQ